MTPETIAALINMGAAGAVIIVVMIFLNYISKRDKDWQNFFAALNATSLADIRQVRDSLDRVVQGINCISVDLHAHDDKVDDRVKIIQVASKKSATKPRVN